MGAALSLVGITAESRPPEKAQQAPDATAEITSIRVARSYGWWPLSATRMILWVGIEEPYLIDVATACPSLLDGAPTGITVRDRRITVRQDRLIFQSDSCQLERLQRADRASLAALGIRREQGRPLPLVPLSSRPARAK